MRYMLMIYGDPAAYGKMSEQERNADFGAYMTFNQEVVARGVLRSGEQLHPAPMATTVRVRDSKTLLTDGPFAETKEVLGGFYIVDCASLDEAVEWAAKLPASWTGSVEVRPLIELDQATRSGAEA
ncbi:MAG: YciI family protein [Chloroflexota bacterium]|nr:YciI family protein [Chloroflexota bacterium]